MQFGDDFIAAYRGTQQRELRVMTDEVYQAGARARAAQEGTAYAPESDRMRALKVRADEAVTAAAGMHAASAAQLQVFATRHASLVADLAALEEEMARLRSCGRPLRLRARPCTRLGSPLPNTAAAIIWTARLSPGSWSGPAPTA